MSEPAQVAACGRLLTPTKGRDPVGEAPPHNTAGPWSPEGLSLKDTLARVAPIEWRAFLVAKNAAQNIPRGLVAGGGQSPETWGRAAASDKALGDLEAALVAVWDRGDIVAKGRRGDPLAEPVIIPSSRGTYRLRITSTARSEIHDPGRRGGKIFDLKFYSVMVPEPAVKQKPTVGRPTPEELVLAEAKRQCDEALDDIPGTKKGWGRKLSNWLAEHYPELRVTGPTIEKYKGLGKLHRTAEAKKQINSRN
jgi:hypothetical protein